MMADFTPKLFHASGNDKRQDKLITGLVNFIIWAVRWSQTPGGPLLHSETLARFQTVGVDFAKVYFLSSVIAKMLAGARWISDTLLCEGVNGEKLVFLQTTASAATTQLFSARVLPPPREVFGVRIVIHSFHCSTDRLNCQ